MKDNRIGGFLCRKVLPTAVLVLAISVLLIRSLSVSMEQEKKTGKYLLRSIGFSQELQQYLWGSGRPEQSAKEYKIRKP